MEKASNLEKIKGHGKRETYGLEVPLVIPTNRS